MVPSEWLRSGFGWQEGLVILGVALLIFGASRIPQIARALGRSAHEFKKGLREGGEPEDEEHPAGGDSGGGGEPGSE